MALVLPQEVQEALVVLRFHVEEPGHDLVVPARLFETAAAEEWSELLGSVTSPTLGAMVRFMDRESDNFTAEMLLKQLGLTELDRGTSAAGAAVVMQTLASAGVPMTGVRIVDGSGRPNSRARSIRGSACTAPSTRSGRRRISRRARSPARG